MFSLRYRGVVLILALLAIAYGAYVSSQVSLDVFPEFVPPQVAVQTEAPGLAPEQVEALVTRPVESAINGAGDIETIRSESIQGLSVVNVVFKEGTNPFTARQLLAEKLAELAGQFPEGVKAPKMSPLTSSTMDLLKIGLRSEKLTPMELRTFADWTLRPRLLAVPGVARSTVFGGSVHQLQVQVIPEKLVAYDIPFSEVVATARAATGIRGAGFIDTPTQRVVLQTDGQSLTPEALGEVEIIQSNGVSVRLRDVARVVDGAEPKFGDSLVQGKPGVLLSLSGQYGANTLETTRKVEAALDELKPLFAEQGIEVFPRLHRPATFIETALGNVQHSLLVGGALVALVLLLFLLDLRTAFISFVTIPLSLLGAMGVLDAFGVSINTMTLGGFAVAIGVVVDDAIIDVENILRRLRENAVAAAPRPLLEVVFDASIEVRGAVVYATFIVAVVFLPVLTMSGLQGRFFGPLGVAFILSVLMSLLVALTVTPALCMVMLARTKPHAEPRYIGWLKALHLRLLGAISQHPWLAMGTTLLILGGSLALVPLLGGELLPEFREGHFVVQVSAAPGTSLAEMNRLGSVISDEILKIPKVATVELQVGRAEQGEDTWGTNRCEFHVELKPGSPGEEEAVQEELRALLKNVPGIQSEVLTFLGDRISETISGETASVVVNVFGDDLDALDSAAHRVAGVLGSVPGAADVQVKASVGAPVLSIKLKPERLTRFGFRPLDVLEAVQVACQGADVAQVVRGGRVMEVAVLVAEEARKDPEALGDLMLANSAGTRLPLKQLADVSLTYGRELIQHEGARRRQTVTCNPTGNDVSGFVAAARKKLAAEKLPAGAYVELSGAAEEESKGTRELLAHSAVAAIGIVVLLALVFRRSRHVILVLVNVPFALIGGVLAVWVHGGTLSIGSMVGFVTLFGITTRNSIMLLSHYQHLVQSEGLPWNLETALNGAGERLVPILMTALVTALGLLPLALGSGDAGREIEGPMAVVILGGLISSTALNLLLLPALALKFGRFETADA
ncbi:efflux RND transporter permease subunit [Luteolibacter sp. LG18]|uniref:efflux RND transporter permease subunit n=1 Tax=Luteolibacter sp. LG18 TaxID=2819286 RepID=UPI0030C74FAD